MGKWPIFDQNHGLSLLEKSQFFDFLKLFVVIAYKGFFFVLEYRKTHFPGLEVLKEKMLKCPIFDQNHGLTPLKKT